MFGELLREAPQNLPERHVNWGFVDLRQKMAQTTKNGPFHGPSRALGALPLSGVMA
jgi:hypothetical protein